jgi:CRP/FNR family transcriptional regulator, cyclic AMP receptor protein
VTTTVSDAFRKMSGGETVAGGTTIFKAGDPADHLFVVQEGGVDIKLGDKVLERIGPCGLFGEMAMIDGSTRSADAVAREDSMILPIDQQRFDFMITETPYFARTVMNVLVDRLRNATATSCT